MYIIKNEWKFFIRKTSFSMFLIEEMRKKVKKNKIK